MGEFGLLNTVVLVTYLAGMLAIGVSLAGRQRSTEEYFLGGRRMPWLAVGMSMFASLTSATTVMGVPGFAYEHNVAMMFGAGMSMLVAPILSLFVLGLLTRRASFRGWLVGLVCGMGLTVFSKVYFGEQLMPIWLIPSSFVVCSILGYGASVLMPASGMVDARKESRSR